MEFNKVSYVCGLLLALTLYLLSVPSVFAQSDQSETDISDSMKKSLAVQEADKKALSKLKKMTAEEVEELDQKLADALTLFYDREYARALPIFRGVSQVVETMDIMFWYATCAYKAGEAEEAVRKFKEMLDIDPNLHRVRLELATSYYVTGKYDLARDQLENVLQAQPPESVKRNIQKLMASIDAKTKKVFTNVRFSQSIQRDTNVSAGPDRSSIGVPGGGTLLLSQTQGKLKDWVTVSNLAGNILYDLGETQGVMWNTTYSFYNTHNTKYHQFDFTHLRASTGLWLVGKKSVFKAPVAFAKNWYEHDQLYDTFDFSPSYEYFYTRDLSLKGTFYYSRDSYDTREKSTQDNINRIWEFNPNFYFNNRNDILSFYISDENLNANSLTYTYNAVNMAVSYFKRFPTRDLELYARYKYSDRNYQAPTLLWTANREDDRHNFYMVLSRNFLKNYFASVYFNWSKNDSNTDIYDFTKEIYGLSLGFKF